MNESTILLTLASIHFIALMSPGPDFALVVQNATRHGRQTGLYIALGLSVGILLHSLFSLTGVSYLVHQHPLLYSVLQLLGGSYLLYLGIGALRGVIATIKNPLSDQPSKNSNLVISNKRQAFTKGFATNILNPKALVFFVSLMSSLVPVGMSVTGKGIALVILFGLSLLWFSSLAWMLSTQRLQTRLQQAGIYIDGLCGVVFTLVGSSILVQTFRSFLDNSLI
ncbi:LysE family translocator [Vibrio diabolicus]|uniref:LysE family translocator n=1 Tax=Vibrio TaxID=662 RepID=UPI0012463FD2|nr:MULTISPECIES: LysE family translocator [Vibrio]MCR9984064.1 LysE family translocator [Vibrio alginolyticus]KAB0321579.1 LysE family translocator [Vibrio diabolicus]MCK8066261.1 LysE family translocator [Vibrio sp. 1CM7H]MCR9366286.1 LysE family translocator [Vibrio antiquarius]MCS0413513.1 LysE family translocator [Vibrio diabolicus]